MAGDFANRLEVIQALSLLQPCDGVGLRKRRLGVSFDGGYVVADDLDAVHAAYSFGIGAEVSFDLGLAEAGITVHQFDHTVDGPPFAHALFKFSKSGVASVDDPASALYSLEHYLRAGGHIGRTDLLLKLDVEGSEFAVLAAAGPGLLRSFRQIVLEVHWLHRLDDPVYRSEFRRGMQCVLDGFNLVHVHGNNCCPVVVVNGLPIADVLELTFIRKDLYEVEASRTVYPTVLDFPNYHLSPDLLLWFYPFLPTFESEVGSQFRACLETAKANEHEQQIALVKHHMAAHRQAVKTLESQLMALEQERAAGQVAEMEV